MSTKIKKNKKDANGNSVEDDSLARVSPIQVKLITFKNRFTIHET